MIKYIVRMSFVVTHNHVTLHLDFHVNVPGINKGNSLEDCVIYTNNNIQNLVILTHQ